MEEQKHTILKKSLLKTEDDFTAGVMNKINAEETAISNILTKYGTIKTSADFTAQLMHQLEGKSPAIPYTPVISKKAWVSIAAVFIGIICLSLFSRTKDPQKVLLNDEVHQFTSRVDALFASGSIFPYLMFGLLILSIGLLVEQKVSTRFSNE